MQGAWPLGQAPCFFTRSLPAGTRAEAGAPAYSYPMALPGHPPGDGFFVRIAYAAENARYYPGWWHTGENWHAVAGETAGMGVHAAASGEVVFAGYDYPGAVVIVAHPDGLYAMFGHLDDALAVAPGEPIARGQLLGTVLARGDDRARSHLHFELRDFFTLPEVNGDAPRYGVRCGYECPPGPGYWPMQAPEHPSDLVWRNPTHVINRRAWAGGVPEGTLAAVSATAPESAMLWNVPAGSTGAAVIGDLPLTRGERYPLLAIDAGEEGATETSAQATRLWYRVALPDGETAWVQAAVPDDTDVGSDGRPSSLRLDFLAVAPPAT